MNWPDRDGRRPATNAIAVLAFTSILLSYSGPAFGQDSLPDTVAAVKPSVVLIVTYNSAGKPLAAGSGFCIAAGRIVTNNHVISGASRITVRLGSGSVKAVKKVLVCGQGFGPCHIGNGIGHLTNCSFAVNVSPSARG